MNINDAEGCLGMLVAGTGGWTSVTDETLAIYTRNFRQLDDRDTAVQAVNTIISTWSEMRRPPWVVVADAYRSEVRRKMMSAPSLPAGDVETVPLSVGRRIAAEAYKRQCAEDGREPSWQHFTDQVVK
jgi:hypothetical protein